MRTGRALPDNREPPRRWPRWHHCRMKDNKADQHCHFLCELIYYDLKHPGLATHRRPFVDRLVADGSHGPAWREIFCSARGAAAAARPESSPAGLGKTRPSVCSKSPAKPGHPTRGNIPSMSPRAASPPHPRDNQNQSSRAPTPNRCHRLELVGRASSGSARTRRQTPHPSLRAPTPDPRRRAATARCAVAKHRRTSARFSQYDEQPTRRQSPNSPNTTSQEGMLPRCQSCRAAFTKKEWIRS